ncbi:hypothetical protein CD351_14835 [Erythrobacter sp. KY5]|nr:hypothetical protein CD351_14835 [Erythrobacter sp. KY5]
MIKKFLLELSNGRWISEFLRPRLLKLRVLLVLLRRVGPIALLRQDTKRQGRCFQEKYSNGFRKNLKGELINVGLTQIQVFLR